MPGNDPVTVGEQLAGGKLVVASVDTANSSATLTVLPDYPALGGGTWTIKPNISKESIEAVLTQLGILPLPHI